MAPSSTEPESGESWQESSEGGSGSRSRPATCCETCHPLSRRDQRGGGGGSSPVAECRVRSGGGQPSRQTVGFSIEVGKSLERARKRVTTAESTVAEAVAEEGRFVAELEEGERRMERLREEARAAPTQRDPVGDELHGVDLDDAAKTRQEILELRQFRGCCPLTPSRGADRPFVPENIPPMPESSHQIERWLSDRNADLRRALASKTDPAIFSQLTDLLSKGAAKLSELEERELAEVGQGSGGFTPY